MKKIIPTYTNFLLEDAATMTDNMNNLLQDIQSAADKRIKSIDKNLKVTGFTQLPGKDDNVITISLQNNAYIQTGTYAISDIKKGVTISQKDWNKWSDTQISKHVQQWLNNLKSGQE